MRENRKYGSGREEMGDCLLTFIVEERCRPEGPDSAAHGRFSYRSKAVQGRRGEGKTAALMILSTSLKGA